MSLLPRRRIRLQPPVPGMSAGTITLPSLDALAAVKRRSKKQAEVISAFLADATTRAETGEGDQLARTMCDSLLRGMSDLQQRAHLVVGAIKMGLAICAEEQARGWASPGATDAGVHALLEWDLPMAMSEDLPDFRDRKLWAFALQAGYYFGRVGVSAMKDLQVGMQSFSSVFADSSGLSS